MDNKQKKADRLNVEAVLGIIGPKGPLATLLPGFESRAEQKAMMHNVLDAYHHNQISLIEAGTGTGKSLAYLIPALLWSVETKERTLISTNTIPLQEQLLNKDIPLVCTALNLNVKAVLVKGMHNYVCLRKFHEAQQERLLLTLQESEELHKIEAWQHSANDGSRSSLPFNPSPAIWDKVCAESDTCNRNACPFFQECHFFKARKQAQEAQILISNHHLLFADLTCRAETGNFKDVAILPAYNRIILDEAHNIEDIATDYFASRASHIELLRLAGRLAAEKKGAEHGKLPFIKEKLLNHYKRDDNQNVKSILQRLTHDLPGLRRDMLQQAHEMFTAYQSFSQNLQRNGYDAPDDQPNAESKLRVQPLHHTHPQWQNQLLPGSKQLSEVIGRYSAALVALTMDLKLLDNPQIEEQTKAATFEINSLALRLSGTSEVIERFVSATIPPSKVRWIESQQLKTMTNISLVDADLDISKVLAENIFQPFSTVILCSATLTTNKHFDFIRSRLGLTKEHLPNRVVKENVYNSPFDYMKQVLLAIPTDIPAPNAPTFISEASEKIWQALLSSRGNAFVLFTSYSMMTECHKILEQRMRENRMNPLKQGDDDRKQLLSKFRSVDHSVLFGTDSFWEGVDVAGEALRCVIIVKLPFKVPTEPLIQARSEAILGHGGDPFMDYSLPQAIVKFKQGFGRLIRNKSDRGCVLCLDNRVLTRHYGKMFLNSLPECQQVFAAGETLHAQIKDFYRRTHYLTQK